MPSKRPLNCSLAPLQTLTGAESQEDHEAAGWQCSQGRLRYSSSHKRPGQWLMIVNYPLPTTRSDDDDDDERNNWKSW